MIKRFAGAICALCLLGASLASPLSAQVDVPLSEYGKLPDVEFTAISPSGERIALVAWMNGERILLAMEDQSRAIMAVKVGDMKIRGIEWIGDDRILLVDSETVDLPINFTTDKAEFSLGRVIAVSDKAQSGVVFAGKPRFHDAIIGNYGIRKIKGTYYGYFGGLVFKKERGTGRARNSYAFDHGRPYLMKVNLENFDVEIVDNSAREGWNKDWLVDGAGEIAYTLEVNDNSGEWFIRNLKGNKIVTGRQAAGAVSLVGISFDGASAIYVERTDEGSDWFEISQAGGEPTPFLDDVSFERLFWNRETGKLMGYTVGEGESERHIFSDKALQKKAERVRKAFTSFESFMSDWNSDLSDVIVRTSGNSDSGSYFAVDLETNRANAVAYERVAIGPDQVGAISTFEYTASDGLELDGILTLPPGAEAKNLPLVMLPHGGPASADYPVFDWWAQAFASRGYAVFQPNFRGSTNRDSAFMRAGYGQYGRKMQTDKSDGLKALAEAGIIDPERACIVGASYGGYAALVGVTIQQGIYKCAVAVAPLSDLEDRYNYRYRASGRDRTRRVSLLEQMGDREYWDDYSPLQHADKADAPIMLIHGKDDTVVPYSHSSKMADKLKDAKKPYELVTLEGEDHWLSLSTTRQQMLENAVRWVEKYNPPN